VLTIEGNVKTAREREETQQAVAGAPRVHRIDVKHRTETKRSAVNPTADNSIVERDKILELATRGVSCSERGLLAGLGYDNESNLTCFEWLFAELNRNEEHAVELTVHRPRLFWQQGTSAPSRE
jgi:hypothetical protein